MQLAVFDHAPSLLAAELGFLRAALAGIPALPSASPTLAASASAAPAAAAAAALSRHRREHVDKNKKSHWVLSVVDDLIFAPPPSPTGSRVPILMQAAVLALVVLAGALSVQSDDIPLYPNETFRASIPALDPNAITFVPLICPPCEARRMRG